MIRTDISRHHYRTFWNATKTSNAGRILLCNSVFKGQRMPPLNFLQFWSVKITRFPRSKEYAIRTNAVKSQLRYFVVVKKPGIYLLQLLSLFITVPAQLFTSSYLTQEGGYEKYWMEFVPWFVTVVSKLDDLRERPRSWSSSRHIRGYRVRYYLWFRASAIGLGTYHPRIRGDYCILF
jgi:hypothetical protein